MPEVISTWKEEAAMREKRKQIGEGVDFQRIRRITGYLVGTTDRFNDAKQSEERQRVKHIVRI